MIFRNRKRISLIAKWAMVVVVFIPYCIIEFIIIEFITKINKRWHHNAIDYVEGKLDNLANKIDAWEKNTPEHTMELLKKDFKK